ncbi:MAG: hypothetical protein MUC28_00110 [Planctomycetes bacterium]|jgi:tRNA G10  N-methylase Trm11|nr:hypothetical protein [Planctomycetota bacterium]
MKNSYFFALGNHPALSAAELTAVLPSSPANNKPFLRLAGRSDVLICDTLKKIDAAKLIKSLGGTVKIGALIGQEKAGSRDIIFNILLERIYAKTEINKKGKFNFGFSCYGHTALFLKTLAMEIKKSLRQRNIASRWVTSRENILSSVIVEQNRLIAEGVEFVLIETGGNLLLGETLAVQPFKELSYRDYGRPARDDYAGMLPPKLAQIMLNLARVKTGDTILDPFCGSGTILTEAMLMGLQGLLGSDISEKAVLDTRKNLDWIKEKFQTSNAKRQIFVSAVADLLRFVKPNSINAVITEPYLGPQRGKIDINKTKKELEALYAAALREFAKILKPAGRVVMVWPVFRASRISHRISPDLSGFRVINPIPVELRQNKTLFITDRGTLLYGRPYQKVWREIVVMSK